MHLEGGGTFGRGDCALQDETCERVLSLHHIHKRPRDDVRANLVWLCGDGTRGHHGKIEAHDPESKRRLGAHVLLYRQDTVMYLSEKLGGFRALLEYAKRNGYIT